MTLWVALPLVMTVKSVLMYLIPILLSPEVPVDNSENNAAVPPLDNDIVCNVLSKLFLNV